MGCQAGLQANHHQVGAQERRTQTTLHLYHKLQSRAGWAAAWSLLTGRSCSLLPLDTIRTTGTVRRSHYAGVQTVPISHIRGSEGRCGDFDAGFRPLTPHNEGRWVRLADAWQTGAALPPVDLIRVDEIYYVQDGHHRISVAKAFGQKGIQAKVTVWEVEDAYACERGTSIGQLVAKPA